MDEGVLCLKWRDHRSTFLRMLSSIRKKGVFCDATLVCDGKFYPVHQLVLSTCSEYFQQLFEAVGTGTSELAGPCRTGGPLVVVLMGVSPRDLEALLEYMYAGEVTILQGDLACFMKAAEGLKVHGLAEPPPPASSSLIRREVGETTKRSLPQYEDSCGTKKKKGNGDNQKALRGKEPLLEIVSPAQLASVELSTDTQHGMERDTATGTPGDLPGPVAPLSPPSRPQIKYEEVQVKDEPQHLEEVEEKNEEWHRHQQEEQQTTILGEGAETAQLLGFHDPGLTYLANTSGLGAVTDSGHSLHLPQNLHTTTGWEVAGTSDNFTQQAPDHLRAATQFQRRMGRPTSEIWLHYTTERTAGRTAVYCRYCSQKYGYPNATKMKIHTLKCSKCPEEVRRQFQSLAKPESGEGQDITPGRLCTEGDVASKSEPSPQYQAQQLQQTADRATECTDPAIRSSKSGSFRIEPETENPSSSKVGFQSQGKSSFKKLQKMAQKEIPSSTEKVCDRKAQHGQFKNPEKLSSANLTDIKQRSCPQSPVKAIIPSGLQQQHSRPLSRSEDRVSLVPERMCHHPVV